jgi:Recombinase/Recombinase zinc beta ribbon domain
MVWKLPVYRSLWAILTNPVYAGAYAFGRREVRTKIVDGRARKSKGHLKPRSTWTVLIPEHHSGYVSWEQYERNQALLASNAHMKSDGNAKAGRGGRALLSGILRCRRCGRMLHVSYTGKERVVPRYDCNDAHLHHGESRRSLDLELEQARYEARLAARRYEAVDPDQRLVAAELEARWNSALQKTRELEDKLQDFDLGINKARVPSKELLLSLAQDLPAIWNSPSTGTRLKQRIVRILIEEVVADVDESSREIVLLLHWAGGPAKL